MLFQSHVSDRGVARQHGGGAVNNNGYGTSQSSMKLLTERVANGYYKTVVCLINLLLWYRTCVNIVGEF